MVHHYERSRILQYLLTSVVLTILIASGASAQTYSSISGPSTVYINSNYTYTITEISNVPLSCYQWSASNGTVTYTSQGTPQLDPNTQKYSTVYSATVQFTSLSGGTISFMCHSQVIASMGVSVADPRLDAPNGFLIDYGCGVTTIRKTTFPEAGVEWWWQTSSTGTSTALGQVTAENNSYSITQATDLYLRPRLTSTGQWGTAAQVYFGSVIVYSTPANPPTVANNKTMFSGATNVALSVAPVSGISQYNWYTEDGVLVYPLASNVIVGNFLTTQTFYVASVKGCESTTRLPVTVTVLPRPEIVVAGGGSADLSSGPVTLTTANYSTYSWTNSEGTVVSTGQTCAATAGKYKVAVTRAGVSGSGTSLFFTVGTNADRNYISSRTVMVSGVQDPNAVGTLDVASANEVIQYFDGIGRPLQEVVRQGSPSKTDVITPHLYDRFGREVVKYLPFAIPEKNGWFKTNPLGIATESYTGSVQYQFYQSLQNVAPDTNPFAVSVYEPSPLNRLIEQGAPGASWQPDANNSYASADHTVKQAYEMNGNNEVMLWKYTQPTSTYPLGLVNVTSVLAPTTPVYYSANKLFRYRAKDENGNEVVDYKNVDGQLILRRIQASASAASINDTNYASTYYIYDDLGNLVTVIPPEAVSRLATEFYQSGATDATKDAFLSAWTYRYNYVDPRRRVVVKQVPGADSVLMIYDNRDRLVMTQDGNQRTISASRPVKEWTFIKYDEKNRPVLRGIYASNADRKTLQAAVNGFYTSLAEGTAWYETYKGAPGAVLGYDNASFPQVLDEGQYNVVNYYDAYDSYIAPSAYNPVNQGLPGEQIGNQLPLRGQLIAARIKNLSTGTWMRTVNYYDSKYRLIQQISDHQKGITVVSNVYDFPGKLLYTLKAYTVNGTQTIIRQTFTYDHMSRPLLVKHAVNGGTDVVIAGHQYNAAGQLIAKKQHRLDPGTPPANVDPSIGQPGVLYDVNITSSDYKSTNNVYVAQKKISLLPGFRVQGGNTFKGRIGFTQSDADNYNSILQGTFSQTIDYRYNIRGWLTQINNADVSTPTDGNPGVDYFGMELQYENTVAGLTTSASYNGNISAIRWSKGNGGTVAKQAYTFKYDPLNRMTDAYHFDGIAPGWVSSANAFDENVTYDLNGNIKTLVRKGAAGANMDNLIYGYSGNTLNYVNDSYDATSGFINGNSGTDDFSYDANGNLAKDKNKGISNHGDIQYNFMNLPELVKKGVDQIKYIYDATGRKLAQEVYVNNVLQKRTDYIGELLFQGDTLKFITHQEGRYLPATSEYQYNLVDHLGNVRVTYTTKPKAPITFSGNFETGTAGSGESDFRNYSSTAYDLVDHTDAGTASQRVQYLNGGNGGRVGAAKSLAVMPGDQITASVYAKYMNVSSTANNNSFALALSSAFGVTSASVGADQKIYAALNSYAGSMAGGDHYLDDDALPKIFITVLLFDKNYTFLDAAWDQVGSAGAQTSGSVKQPPHDLLSVTVNAEEAGYAYIFISNENPTFVDAYFDDLSVTHTLSPIVAMSDYFPYGLTYNDMQRSNSWEPKYLYGGKELQDELALNWYDFGARMYMPEIGRWGVIDPLAEQSRRWTPYRYGFDNPMRFIDPDGMSEVEGVNYSDGYSTQNTKTTTGSIELWQLSADAQQKVNTIRGIRDALLGFIKNSSTTTNNNSYSSGGDDKTEAGVSAQQGVTITITSNITDFTTVRGYPTNVVDTGGKVLYEVPTYQITVSTGKFSTTFNGIRFGVTTRSGNPVVKGVVSGTYSGTWGVMGHGLGLSLHVDGASNGGIWIHDGPDNLSRSAWGAEGCIEITGKDSWQEFKTLMSNIAPQGTPISIIFIPTEVPSLKDSGKRF